MNKILSGSVIFSWNQLIELIYACLHFLYITAQIHLTLPWWVYGISLLKKSSEIRITTPHSTKVK